MATHSKCEWNNVRVLDTQYLRVLRENSRNKCHVGLQPQKLNAGIQTKHPISISISDW